MNTNIVNQLRDFAKKHHVKISYRTSQKHNLVESFICIAKEHKDSKQVSIQLLKQREPQDLKHSKNVFYIDNHNII